MAVSNRRKAALALVAMGPERAAETLRALPEHVVVELLAEVNAVGAVDASVAQTVLSELAEGVSERSTVGSGGSAYSSELLRRTVGDSRAAQISQGLEAGAHRPFAYFEQADPEDVARVLADESPSTIALVIAHVEATMGAAIFGNLGVELRAEVGLRLAQLQTIHQSVVAQVDDNLRTRLAPLLKQPTVEVPGLELLVEVVNNSTSELERSLLAAMTERDPDLAMRVREALFVFDDVIRLDDRAIQEVLKSIDTRVLAIALKDAAEELAERFFRNLSERARANLQEEIEYLSGVKPTDIKDARKQVVAVIRQLEEEGVITIERGGGGDE